MTDKTVVRRCAVYTRKSSEEGLEQEFNSLQAQREACEAFIKSQKGEGWKLIPTLYDDGGISGGTMERPRLQRLLADIQSNLVDIVVVYKVDRLTRALSDFAKMVEVFDAYNVSFVSVTQQFNTTTSMGRLTLNVLLSFAQFEREVTGERIRDKIAASKKKGMWMGGNIPIGYDVKDRRLVINEFEAITVKLIFDLFLKLGSTNAVKQELDKRGLKSKRRVFANGTIKEGSTFWSGMIYYLLSNPVYIGLVRHKKVTHAGQHAPIIDKAIWDKVQESLHTKPRHNPRTERNPAPLKDKLFADNEPLVPSHCSKDGRRYDYYVSRSLTQGNAKPDFGWRIPAPDMERAAADAVRTVFTDSVLIAEVLREEDITTPRISKILDTAAWMADRPATDIRTAPTLHQLIERIEISESALTVTVALGRLQPEQAEQEPLPSMTRKVPMAIRRRGIETKLIIASTGRRPANTDTTLIKAVARAHQWFQEIVSDPKTSLRAIARREGISHRYVHRLIRLAFLAPEIVTAIIEGEQPSDLCTEEVTEKIEVPVSWDQQKQLLGFR